METMNPVWSPRIIKKGNGDTLNHFEVISFFKPTGMDLRDAQKDMGYGPRGYGTPYVYSQTEKNGMWITKWSCQGSCD